jgi:hypothetical protein
MNYNMCHAYSWGKFWRSFSITWGKWKTRFKVTSSRSMQPLLVLLIWNFILSSLSLICFTLSYLMFYSKSYYEPLNLTWIMQFDYGVQSFKIVQHAIHRQWSSMVLKRYSLVFGIVKVWVIQVFYKLRFALYKFFIFKFCFRYSSFPVY